MPSPHASSTQRAHLCSLLALSLLASACNDEAPTALEAPTESPSAAMVNNAYLIADLGTLYRGTESIANAINDFGVIVGTSEVLIGAPPLRWRAFRYTNGSMTELGALPGLPESTAEDINAAGWIAGSSSNDYDETRPFLWKPGQGMLDLGHLDNKGYTNAYAINSTGVVVGTSTRDNEAGNNRTHAFRWTANGGMQALGAEHDYSWAYDVNDAGWVAGAAGTWPEEHAYIWDPAGKGIHIGTLGGSYSRAYAINNAGVVIGMSETTYGDYAAFRWTPWTGIMADLSGAVGYHGHVQGLSEKGRIVGALVNIFTGPRAATLFGRTPAYLPGFVPNERGVARGVNTCGTIVGNRITKANQARASMWVRAMGVCD